MSSDPTASVLALQTVPAFGELEANLDAVGAQLEAALADGPVDLIVLPELFASGYAFRDGAELATLAEDPQTGPTAQRMAAWSEATGALIVGGFPERAGDGIYNSALVVAEGRTVGCYRKLHLFGFERELFTPGDGPLPVFEYAGLRVGVMICFDWIFPEAARCLALAGADVIAHPSNLVLPGWCQRAMGIRSIENRVFTITANRAGRETRDPRPSLRFTGASQITSPAGEVLAQGPEDGPARLKAVIDPSLARSKTIASGNDLWAERRPVFYAALVQEP